MASTISKHKRSTSRVLNEGSRAYFDEAMKCYKVQAYRASTVMLSCAIFEDLRVKAADFAQFDKNAATISENIHESWNLQKSFETNFVNLLKKWKLMEAEDTRYLRVLIETRNQAAHASGINISKEEVDRLIDEGMERFLSKKLLWGIQGVEELVLKMKAVDMFPATNPYGFDATAFDALERLLPRYHFQALDTMVERIETGGALFFRNATTFLRVIADRHEPERRPHLFRVLLSKRSLPANSAWVIGILAANPAILLGDDKKLEDHTDASLAAIIDALSPSDEARLDELEIAVRWMLKNLKREQLARYNATLLAAARKIWDRPSWILNAKKQEVRATFQHTLFMDTSEPEGAERFANAVCDRWEEGYEELLVKALEPRSAFVLLRDLFNGAQAGQKRCSALAKSKWAAMPFLRTKAEHFLEKYPGRAEDLLANGEEFGISAEDFHEKYLSLPPGYRLNDDDHVADEARHQPQGNGNVAFLARKRYA